MNVRILFMHLLKLDLNNGVKNPVHLYETQYSLFLNRSLFLWKRTSGAMWGYRPFNQKC